MIKKIEGLKRFLHARMANTKEEFENQGRVIGYNEAIDDVVKLLNIPVVSNRSCVICDAKNSIVEGVCQKCEYSFRDTDGC